MNLSKLSITKKKKDISRMWLILAVVLAADIMDMLDATLTNIAAPVISKNLGGGQNLIQWLGTSYALSMGVFLVVGGRLGDKYGQRKIFLIGIAGFTLASLSCGLSTGSSMLIISRLLQGGFGALLIPQGMAIMTANFPRDMMSKAFSVFGPVMGISAILGPIMAGYIIHANIFNSSWRSMFLINIILGVIGYVTAFRILPADHKDMDVVLDGPGSGILGLTMFFLLYGLIDGTTSGWGIKHASIIVAGLLFLILFFWRQADAASPLIKPSLLKNKGFTSGLILGLIYFAVVSGLCFVISLFLQVSLGSSPFESALEMTPLAAGIIVSSVVTPNLMKKFGRNLITLGLLITSAGAALFYFTINHPGHVEAWDLSYAIFIMGFGMGFCFGTIFDVAIGDIAHDEAGSASGSLSAVQQLASAMGSAVITSVFFSTLKKEGDIRAMKLSLVVAILATVSCSLLVRMLPEKTMEAHE